MSPKTPRINGSKLVRALEKLGFAVKRQKGSHVTLYRESDKRRVTVPVHGNKEIPIGTLKSILKDAEISAEELIISYSLPMNQITPKILIISSDTGGGHRSAAAAIVGGLQKFWEGQSFAVRTVKAIEDSHRITARMVK